jgi:hypothetical protein
MTLRVRASSPPSTPTPHPPTPAPTGLDEPRFRYKNKDYWQCRFAKARSFKFKFF